MSEADRYAGPERRRRRQRAESPIERPPSLDDVRVREMVGFYLPEGPDWWRASNGLWYPPVAERRHGTAENGLPLPPMEARPGGFATWDRSLEVGRRGLAGAIGRRLRRRTWHDA